MKKTVTKFIIPALTLVLALAFTASAQIQTGPTDTANKARTDTTFKHNDFKPGGRLWGYAFGDLYFLQHADKTNRGGETNYAGVPANRNAFQFRRIYLGYDYDISKQFSAEVLLAVEPNANTGTVGTSTVQNGDDLGDGKMSFFIKNFDLRWKNVWSGTDFIVGELSTPAFPLLSEKIWGYRSIERTIADFHKTNSYDLGASLQGAFDPKTKNYGYDLMIANNTQASLLSASNPNTGFYKAFYGDVFAKFLNKSLIFDLYADFITTNQSILAVNTPAAGTTPAVNTPYIGQQSKNMVKGFIAYTTPKITFGVEAYTQNVRNGVTETSTVTGAPKIPVNATVQAISIYSHGSIIKNKMGFFARYDSYNPDENFNAANVYTVNTNLSAYSPYTKEHFITGGFDLTPAKNVHFMPNIWFIQYVDQRPTGTAGYVPNNHILVYRMTFFFQFGK